MRTTLRPFFMLAMLTATANAQTTYVGPWQPQPTIGVALGAFDYHLNNDRTNRLLSATVEIPFSDQGRVRIEAGRGGIRVPAGTNSESYRFTGDATISRLTVSIAGLTRPGDIVSPYVGLGGGFYRLTHDNLKTSVKTGLYAHGGAEVPVSNSSSLNFELGLHGIGRDFIRVKSAKSLTSAPTGPESDWLFEAVIRLKIGL
jgi:hypothetical protein